MVPTLLGYPKMVKINTMQSQKDELFVGLDALKRSPLLSLKYPIEHGIILDWDEISVFISHLISSCMKTSAESLSGGLLMTEAPLNPKKNREKLTEIMFE